MTKSRKNELLDLVLKYNDLLRAETKDMTNDERVFFIETHLIAVGGALSIFRQAVENGNGAMK